MVAFTKLRAWDRATQLTFTIVQAELQWWPLQSCGYGVALHSLPLQLCKPSYSGGLCRVVGVGSRYTAYVYNCASRALMMRSAELRVWDRATQLTFTNM